jgi:hypothetical protein
MCVESLPWCVKGKVHPQIRRKPNLNEVEEAAGANFPPLGARTGVTTRPLILKLRTIRPQTKEQG